MAGSINNGGGGSSGAVVVETDPVASPALATHAAKTTGVHGITNAAALLTSESDPVASAALTTHAAQTAAVHGIPDTSALLKSGGTAGGDLTGTYPNPTVKAAATIPSPVLTGTPTTPDQTPKDKSTKVANTKYVDNSFGALDASVPDKIAWEYPAGTDVIETYGLVTPAGAYVQQQIDDFTSDSRSDYLPVLAGQDVWVLWSGTALRDAGNYFVVANNKASWLASDTTRVAGRMTLASAGTPGAGMRWGVGYAVAAGSSLGVAIEYDGKVYVIHGDPLNGSVGDGSLELLGTKAGGFAINTNYVLRFTRSGNNYTAEVLDGTETTVLFTASGTLPVGAKRTAYGSGVTLKAGMWLANTGGTLGNTDLDWIRLDAAQAEQRDLFLAVTPASGTRTVKRLFGAVGATTFRSDYALTADPVFSGTLGIPQTTLAARPSVASVGGGKLIYVTDANVGEKFQISEASTSAWFPVSFVSPPNTQTASYTLVITDVNRTVEMNAAGATTVTVPPNSSVAFPVGSILEVNRLGAGTVAVAAGAGVTIRSRGGLLSIGNQYGSVSLRKRATDEWVMVGDLA